MEMFDKDILEFKKLLQTTHLKQGYQKTQQLLRNIRNDLNKEMKDYRFQAKVAENNMEYAYFQGQDELMKAYGLKVVVIFDYLHFDFEVWISGVNRQIQVAYQRYLQTIDDQTWQLTNDPLHQDYILRYLISGIASYENILKACKEAIEQAAQMIETWLKVE